MFFKTLLNTIRENRYFFIPLLLFYCFAIYRISIYSKIDNHLFFNQFVGNPFVDSIFKYLTYLGDGFFVVFIALIWSMKNLRQSLILLITYGIAGGLVGILKNYVFDVPRPHFVFDYFHKDIFVKYVEGVEVLALNSFPSGHSTSAMVLFTCFAFYFSNPAMKFLMSILGILVAFSRVYLSQHWINDITAGTFIGWSITFIFYTLEKYYHWFENLNHPIRYFFKKK